MARKVPALTYFLRTSVVVLMVLSVSTFLHFFNYLPQQTFLSCDRPCHHLDWPMICRVKLTLEPFHTLSKACGNCPANETACLAKYCVSADGHHRGILAANRQLPGPSIQVCENDILVVDVVNRLPGKAASIHWRGQTQRETPCMDGVPLVTQCPIPSYTTFQYKFRASVPGTHLWHSHSGVDVANGIFGSLIVRQADAREPHRLLYDVDDPNHAVLVSQWHHSIVTDTAAGQANKKPALLLINGKGHQPNGPQVPLSSFNVTRGLRYRFRLAHAGGAGACPITFAVEEHPLTLIALDGNPVVPLKVKSITLAKGERADFVLRADKIASSKDVYSINVHTDKGCHATVIGSALLRYQGVISTEDSSPVNLLDKQDHLVEMTTNPSDKCNSPGNVCSTEIKATTNLPTALETTDLTIYLPINQRMQPAEILGDLEMRVMSIKNKTFTYPSSPLLTQGPDVPQEMLCNENEHYSETSARCRQHNGNTACECVNTRRIPVGSSVEIILIDQVGRNDLVYHLHGYNFYVVAGRRFGREKTLDEIIKLNQQNLLFSRNLESPAIKDTITVPKFGAVAIRFKADNPGYWMLRDENALEWTRGLDVILQVGDPGDMVPPPQDFPKCGSFVGPDYFLI
ncbi:laccase-4-like isoform X1 [Cotesia glomerata]|uniref:laccase-4-like isoform X1 n=1 Tax=Cotesia glomerata TaxID=32391 RepID=UPI001D00D549|nr:laccase-4-like isoform X1 [Cotesia glomerata]